MTRRTLMRHTVRARLNRVSVADELVAITDPDGRVSGAEPRWRVRRDNLRHLATGVIVRDRLGLVYVHRRTTTKDVYPGMHDCCAGGVVTAGETPDDAARRELAEELGISGVPLRRLLRAAYADEVTRYHAYVYEVTWDGPISHQAEEVAWGGWMDLAELCERLADPSWAFVPDSRALIGDWLHERLTDRRQIVGGWDSDTTLVEGRWIDRVPRRPEVGDALLTETRLLPWLAPQLPLTVPIPSVVGMNPLRVRHAVVPGQAGGPASLDRAMGEVVGSFLRTLHAASVAEALARGVPGAAESATARDHDVARFRNEVLPLLPGALHPQARALLAAVAASPNDTLVHGDLGPDHLLVANGRVSGVIDWSDTRIGDRALDLAWTLCGTPPGFAAGLAEAYGVDHRMRERARRWRQLGPWHEVTYGLDTGQPAYVESGLAGAIARLATNE